MSRPPLSDHLCRVLVCPVCRGRLAGDEGEPLRCPACSLQFGPAEHGIPDFRPPRHTVQMPVTVGLPTPHPPAERIAPFAARPDPEVDFSAVDVPHHLTRDLLSHFPAARRAGALALDLGCGTGLHRGVIEHAGFECIAIDYSASGADLLADAHALPFVDRAFDFVMSIAVFEHLRVPPLAAREVHRVLAEGGLFVGTVAFLEPYHSLSYYHHSHLATWSLLADAGFEVQRVAPRAGWQLFAAHASKSLFPGMPRWLARTLVAPMDALHRLWWRLMRHRHPALAEAHRLRRLAGAFSFVARRPGDRQPTP